MGVLRLIFAAVFAAGVLTLAGAFLPNLRWGEKSRSLFEIRQKEGLWSRPPASLRQRLASMLFQARASVSVTEFLFFSLLLGLAMGGVFLFTTRAPVLGLAGLLGGGLLYYLYLLDRRQRLANQYELLQPQVATTLLFSFWTAGKNLDAALHEVAENGPLAVRQDWKTIRAAFSGKRPNVVAITDLLTYRASPGLARLVELLLLFWEDVEQVADLLPGLKEQITQEVEIGRENAANLMGPRRELFIAALFPVGLVLVFSAFAPALGNFYSTVVGQLVVLLAWGLTALIVVFASRQAQRVVQPRPFTYLIPEERRESAFTPFVADPDEEIPPTAEAAEEAAKVVEDDLDRLIRDP